MSTIELHNRPKLGNSIDRYIAGSVHCGLVRSDQRGNYVQPARLYSMLRYADRTTILLCVCPSGQKKVRKPFSGVDVISLWVGRELALVCNSSGWRMVGEETRWWVRRPDGGCCPRRCQVNSCCCSNAGLNQPPSLHPSYHPPTCLCLPACVLPSCLPSELFLRWPIFLLIPTAQIIWLRLA